MVDEAGWNVSVTKERYLNMWKNEVWPIVRTATGRCRVT